jgi:hypothetical protein
MSPHPKLPEGRKRQRFRLLGADHASGLRRRKHILEEIEQHGSPCRACASVGVTSTCLNDERRRDPDFDAACRSAMEAACEEATGAAIERGVRGYMEPVVSAGHVVEYTDPETGERRPLEVRRYSDQALVALLRRGVPDTQVNVSMLGDSPIPMDMNVFMRLPPGDRQEFRRIMAAYRALLEGRPMIDVTPPIRQINGQV